MAEPKKRTNRSKRNMRRMHDKVVVPNLVFCPDCHEAKKPHLVCPNCGNYKGVKVLSRDEEATIKTENVNEKDK